MAVVNEIEARAWRHAFMTATHSYKWRSLAGPLIAWAAFFVFMVAGGILSRDPSPVVTALTMSGE